MDYLRKRRGFRLELPTDVSKSPKGRKSLTLPNEAYSIEELLVKYSQGIMPAVSHGTYNDPSGDADFDSVDLEKVNKMDMVERDDLLNSGREAIRRVDEKVRKFSELKTKVKPTKAGSKVREAKEEERSDDDRSVATAKRTAKGGSKLSLPDGD